MPRKASSEVKKTRKSEPKKTRIFSTGDFVVYPAHGVGKVTDIEKQVIGGQEIE